MKYGPTREYWNDFVFEAYVNYRTEAIYLAGLPDIPESRPHSKVNSWGFGSALQRNGISFEAYALWTTLIPAGSAKEPPSATKRRGLSSGLRRTRSARRYGPACSTAGKARCTEIPGCGFFGKKLVRKKHGNNYLRGQQAKTELARITAN